jgi:hypothetical protein
MRAIGPRLGGERGECRARLLPSEARWAKPISVPSAACAAGIDAHRAEFRDELLASPCSVSERASLGYAAAGA